MISVDLPSRPVAPQHSRIHYRPDVDGLRAVAVLSVVGFHAAASLVPGGFIGVDVFFVISGFLISGILFTQAAEGRFDLVEFYVRRIRRIFPALVVVLIGCGLIGWLVLVGDEFRILQKDIAAGAAFVSNFVFWREAGYFDTPSQFKPLLHLWSLGIEEQFYLFWPPLVYLCWKRGLNVATLTVVVALTSFWLNVSLTGTDTAAAFFLPHTRIWELMLGGLLAYVECFKKSEAASIQNRLLFSSPARYDERLLANAKAWIGIGLILFAARVLDSGMPYPGWAAALPTLGAALLITAGTQAWLNRRVLSHPAVVYIGLISYPLYLWHWPLLSFVQITESGVPSRTIKAAAVLVSFVLAALTYHLIERPARRGITRRTLLRFAALASSLVIVGSASLLAYRTGAIDPRTPRFQTEIAPFRLQRDDECHSRFPTLAEECVQYAKDVAVTTALLGDSHAVHFLDGVGARLLKKGENVVLIAESLCPPLMDIESHRVGAPDRCAAVTPTVLGLVADNPKITRVVMSFRGALLLTGRGVGDVERYESVVFRKAGSLLSSDESLRLELDQTVDRLLNKQKDVWLILQVPELGFHIGECVGRPFSFEHKLRQPCAVPRPAVMARQATYRQIVQQVHAKHPALRVFDPLPYVCDAENCFGIIDQTVLYRDDDHLSRAGSLYLADKFGF